MSGLRMLVQFIEDEGAQTHESYLSGLNKALASALPCPYKLNYHA